MAYSSRVGTLDDLDRIVEIWKAGIENSLGTVPPDGHDYQTYFRKRLAASDETFRFTMVEEDGVIVGWLSLTPFRSNPAVKGMMAELSAYVAPEVTSGRAITYGFDEMLLHADNSPLQYIVAFVLCNNIPAAKLCRNHGFRALGDYPVSDKAPDATPLTYFVRACSYREAQSSEG